MFNSGRIKELEARIGRLENDLKWETREGKVKYMAERAESDVRFWGESTRRLWDHFYALFEHLGVKLEWEEAKYRVVPLTEKKED